MTRHRRLVALTAAALVSPLAVVAGLAGSASPSSGLAPAAAAAPAAGPQLWTPPRTTGELYGKRKKAYVELPVRLVAGSSPIEVWATRPSYSQPIRVVVKAGGKEVVLPAGSMSTFNGLDDFLSIKVTKARTGKTVLSRTRDACLNGTGQRVRPEAPARSEYPTYCFANPYSLGTVQGIESGWSNPVLGDYGVGMRLPKGRYVVTTQIQARWAKALGISAADSRSTMKVAVTKAHDHDDHEHEHGDSASGSGGGGAGGHRSTTARPAGTDAPTGRRIDAARAAAGPTPNLRSLPAWGISVAGNGNFLRFAATVWNAGNSPLVVDGYRDPAKPGQMNAYQYFFDGEGEQTGYQPIGSFEFDTKESHQHWHFKDFASYTLLRADKSTAVVSRKEAFCLANTDAVDLTVPDADWNPTNTDLSTDCGFEDSLSLRQVLAAGWGDTYAQFRAGQSFSLKGLKNGTYYIATIANPRGRLIESSKDDNVSLRKVIIGGKPGARTVRVPKIGVIVEPTEQW